MHTCHFSDNDRTAYCGVSVAEMVTDYYTTDGLDAVTCAVCLEVINDRGSVPHSPNLYCACVPSPGRWRVADMVVCPRCGHLACAKCYQQHREDCPGAREVANV